MGVSRLFRGLIHQPHTGTDLAAWKTAWDTLTHTQIHTQMLIWTTSMEQIKAWQILLRICNHMQLVCRDPSCTHWLELKLGQFDTVCDLSVLLGLPSVFLLPSFTPDSICRLAAAAVHVHTAAPGWAKLALAGTGKSPNNLLQLHRQALKWRNKNKTHFLWQSRRLECTQEAPSFRLGAKWFWEALSFFFLF